MQNKLKSFTLGILKNTFLLILLTLLFVILFPALFQVKPLFGLELVYTPDLIVYKVESASDNIGTAMSPTINIGTATLFVSNLVYKPRYQDIIVFECNVSKCKDNQNKKIVRRYISSNKDGCMDLIADNPLNSKDTSDYGCLMPDEIRILGTLWVNTIPKI